MDLIERVTYLMKIKQVTASAFAEKIGVQRSSVSHVLSGRNKPSLEFIQKILRHYPKVDAAWLINGVASVNQDTEQINSSSTSHSETPAKETSETKVDRKNSNTRQVEKIMVLYTDQSYEWFSPGAFEAK